MSDEPHAGYFLLGPKEGIGNCLFVYFPINLHMHVPPETHQVLWRLDVACLGHNFNVGVIFIDHWSVILTSNDTHLQKRGIFTT